MRIYSEEQYADKPIYDKVWQLTKWTNPDALLKAILNSLHNRPDKHVFKVVFDQQIGHEVYLRDVLSILMADKPTIWLQVDYEGRSAVLVVSTAPVTPSSVVDPAQGKREDDSQKTSWGVREVNKTLHSFAKVFLKRETLGSDNAFLPFWQQQPWCRHLIVRLLAAHQDYASHSQHYLWANLERCMLQISDRPCWQGIAM